MRGRLVVGNWKMNGGLQANAALLEALRGGLEAAAERPRSGGLRAVSLPGAGARRAWRARPIAWGAQDVSAHAVRGVHR